MKLIEITCPKCKATMKVDTRKKELICEYCNNKILLDDEVKKVKHINVGQIDEEQEYVNAKTNLKFKEYENAYNGYLSLSKRYVDDPEVWIGLLRSLSMDFTNKDYNELYEKYWNKYEMLAFEDSKKYKEKYEKYINKFNGYDKLDAKNKQNVSKENDLVLVTLLGGIFGLHKFMTGKVGMGILYLFTGGLFGIGWIIDCIKEVKKHPERRSTVSNCIGCFVLLMGICIISSELISGILLIICGLLCIDKISRKIWKEPVKYSLYIKIGLFVLALLLSPSPAYYNTFDSDKYEITINSEYITILDKENNETNKYTYNISVKNNIEILKSSDGKVYEFDKETNKLCLINDNKCEIEFVIKNNQ